MFDYEVIFVFDHVYVGVAVVADSELEAVEFAHLKLVDSDIQYPEPNEVSVELVGGFS